MPGSLLYNSSKRDSHLQILIKERMENKNDEGNGGAPNKSSSSIAQQFQDDGVVGPLTILSQQEAQEAYQQYMEWISTLPQQQLAGDARFKSHLYLFFVNRIARHPTLVKAVQEALQTSNILLWSSDFNVKLPNSPQCFEPHQDSTYAGLQPASSCLTAWIALSSDPVGIEQGCLSFWKGSHTQGQLPHVENVNNTTNMLSRRQQLSSPLDHPNDCIAIPLHGGQATLHSFFTVHASGPNVSSKPRVGLALRYMDANVRQVGTTRECVTLISGSIQHDGFDLEPILPENPTPHDIEKGKEAHAEAMKREAANYFDGTNTTSYL